MKIIQMNDRRDHSRQEAILIHASHYLWSERRKALKSGYVEQYHERSDALEIIWEAKRQVREELKAERTENSKKLRELFALKKAA